MRMASRRIFCGPSFRFDHTTVTMRVAPDPDTVTRGGCSLFALASPSWSFTRRGSENVAPPSLLVARYTFVEPSFVAVHTAATVRPAIVSDGVAFTPPGTPSVVAGDID